MPAPVLRTRTKYVRCVERIHSLLEPVPQEWLVDSTGLAATSCTNYETVVDAWRKALEWTWGLDCALSVMLSAVASTQTLGDQLWIRVIGPASCAKTTLCEALSTSPRYVVAKSSIRGFHSGCTKDEKDNSLIPLIMGKTLVTKDGDTLLQAPNLPQILSEARDLYDSTARTHYRNSVARDYAGIRMTWILCGTHSLRLLDTSELGERFLTSVIMNRIDDDLEDEIGWRAALRADKNVALESNGKPESQYDPDLSVAMSLTGGYVEWLRENAVDLLGGIRNPEESLRQSARLGKFVAYMRARPSTRQDETAERELSARLVSQLVRLGKCLALVLNREEVDRPVMDRVKKVAFDTAQGRTLEIVKELHQAGQAGMRTQGVGGAISMAEAKVADLLWFLRRIGVVERFRPKTRQGTDGQSRWRLTERLRSLYLSVL